MVSSIDAFFASMPEWLGTLPQFISAIGIAGILGLLVKYRLGTKEMDVRAHQIRVEGEKVDDAAEAVLRTHFKSELERLSNEINAAKERQLACEDREEKLRKRVRELERHNDERDREWAAKVKHLEDEVTGLQRVISFNSSALLLGSDGQTSEAVREAAIRVLEALAKGEAAYGER